MLRTKFLIGLLCAASAGCSTHRAAPVTPAPQVAGPVTIWRGVKVIAGTTRINWTKDSFGVSGQPPTLSFFDAKGAGQQCWLKVTVTAPNVPAQPGDLGSVALTIPDAPGGINPSPWAVVFDNNPPGHWSITKTVIGGDAISNTAASNMAAAVFQASTAAGQVTIEDGTVQGCQA